MTDTVTHRIMLAGMVWTLVAAGAATAEPAGAAAAVAPACEARGRNALRAMDCARCHGRDYRGWSAPSLIAAVRDGSRERFDWYVLEGDVMRGMPGYRSQPLVVAEIDAIYAYLRVLDGPGMFGGWEPCLAPGG